MYKRFGKRVFDFLFASFLIVFFSPILLVIALLVVITMGRPILFIQQRVGLNGDAFGIIKFRTMINDAEKTGTGLDSYEDDPRVTKFGRFLRNSSLDELPQLFNIWKGDMSFVGPRPPVTYSPFTYENYPEPAIQRFKVKPGVTGLAQINGRNELSWDEKFKFDVEYVNRYGFFSDMLIIIKTGFKVLKNEGSYDKKKS